MRNDRITALAYGSYDFSNSGYALAFQSFLFPLFLASGRSGDGSTGTVWGAIVAASSVAAILVGPSVGRFADHVGKGGVFAVLVVLTGVLAATTPLALEGHLWALAAAFVAFNMTFELSQTLYDSFLLDFRTNGKAVTHLSTFAWGFGYVGGALFAIAYLLLDHSGSPMSRSLMVLGFLYLFLSLPAIIAFWRRAPTRRLRSVSITDSIKATTPVPWRDIALYWLIADSLGMIMYFTPLYMREELRMDTRQLGMLLLGMQLLAFPLTILMGRIGTRYGLERTIRLCLVGWLLGLVGLCVARSMIQVLPALVVLAFVVGSTQALLRAHFALRVSAHRSGEAFGFYAVAQKSASVVAPAMVTAISWATGSLRPIYIVAGVFMTLALVFSKHLPRVSVGERITTES